MNVEDVKCLLAAISQTLSALKEFPVFEEVIEDYSYYTMSDLTVSDAIQALDEIVQGIENVNAPDHQFSDLYLTPDLEGAITHLGELGMLIVHTDTGQASCLCENKAAAQQDRHDIQGGCNVLQN